MNSLTIISLDFDKIYFQHVAQHSFRLFLIQLVWVVITMGEQRYIAFEINCCNSALDYFLNE